MKKSTLKLREFNLVEPNEAKQLVKDWNGELVDLEDFPLWQNAYDTVVVKVPNKEFAKGVVAGSQARADEVNRQGNVLRLWWD
jgi:hypothetical protein